MAGVQHFSFSGRIDYVLFPVNDKGWHAGFALAFKSFHLSNWSPSTPKVFHLSLEGPDFLQESKEQLYPLLFLRKSISFALLWSYLLTFQICVSKRSLYKARW